MASQTSRTFSPSLASTSPVVSLSMNLAGSETVAKIILIGEVISEYRFTSAESNFTIVKSECLQMLMQILQE